MTEVPEAARGHPEIQAIAELTTDRSWNIVHLIYQSKAFEGHSKDYEFGLEAMREHWQSGLDDIRRTLADPRRLSRPAPDPGLVTHDVHREGDRETVVTGKRVSNRVALGGRGLIKKKK